jgi:hypothetical protein
MWWRNLGLPGQSMIFGMAVMLTVMLLHFVGLWSLYFISGQHSKAPCDAVAAQTAARNHSRCEPYDVSAPRHGSQSDYDAGHGLPGKGR